MSIFDTDGFKERTHGGPSLIADVPDGVVVTTHRHNVREGMPPMPNSIRVAIGERLARRMKWIRGDRVVVGFKRSEKLMGIERSNSNSANMLRTHHQSKRSTGNLHFVFSSSRIADDLRQAVVDWIGSEGRIIPTPLFNDASIYWEMTP